MILITNNKKEMISMTLIILGKDGVDLRLRDIESVHVIFTDGNVEIFEPEYTDTVILNHSEVKYIKVNVY